MLPISIFITMVVLKKKMRFSIFFHWEEQRHMLKKKKILRNNSREYNTQQITEKSVMDVNSLSFGLAYGSKKTLTSWIPHSAKQ